jgi:hypothetical protein
MNAQQPEALCLADRLMHGNPTWTRREAAAELRRLHEVTQNLLGALKALSDTTGDPPDRDCSCHISPPCNDCVEYSGWRAAFEFAQRAIAKADTAQKDLPKAVADATI